MRGIRRLKAAPLALKPMEVYVHWLTEVIRQTRVEATMVGREGGVLQSS